LRRCWYIYYGWFEKSKFYCILSYFIISICNVYMAFIKPFGVNIAIVY
jgi:hypothetical protein